MNNEIYDIEQAECAPSYEGVSMFSFFLLLTIILFVAGAVVIGALYLSPYVSHDECIGCACLIGSIVAFSGYLCLLGRVAEL